jgi:hypothetical protein
VQTKEYSKLGRGITRTFGYATASIALWECKFVIDHFFTSTASGVAGHLPGAAFSSGRKEISKVATLD